MSNCCFSQGNSDYKIYSLIIDDLFLQRDSAKKHIDNAVIINRLETETNWVSEAYDYIDYAFFENTMDTVTKKETKKMLLKLRDLYTVNPIMQIDSFTCSVPLHLINNDDFNKLFSKNIQKGWNKFYKIYPRAIGTFSFTKVIYSGDLAVLFVNFRRNGLAASGDVYIMKRLGTNYFIFNRFNIYVA
jgi:hypothetical protein